MVETRSRSTDQPGGLRHRLLLPVTGLILQALAVAGLPAAEWQWSVPDGDGRAYLWIPSDCARVRALVVANHNMIEQGILEHPIMRRTLSDLGFAELWVVPALDATFDFNHSAGEHFERVVADLAACSGYAELRLAPVAPLGHSACATFPWNFAAWNPGRTLAVLSVHGDAPQTTLTGNGKPRIDWGDRSIDGVPGLMVMGEYEWWEDRLEPALAFQARHPATPLAFLADAGHGHFDYSDDLVAFLALFLRKAAVARLPPPGALDAPVSLIAVDPRQGWRMDRWRKDLPPRAMAAPDPAYAGERRESFWCFDREQADAAEAIAAKARGKLPQLIGVTAPGSDPQGGAGEPVTPHPAIGDDGVTFHLQTAFMGTVSDDPHNDNARRWAGLPGGSPLGHAEGGGPITLSRIVGPAIQTGEDAFAISFGRAEYPPDRRNHDIWVVASHPGDGRYKSIVQQALVRIPENAGGAEQRIAFPAIADQPVGAPPVHLAASTDAGTVVRFFVREGPAEIVGDELRFTAIPPRSRFPIAVTVVAWQNGSATIRAATPVERTFRITR